MSSRRRQISLPRGVIGVLLACTSLVACGDGSNDKLLTPADASELRSTLAQVEQQIDNGDCSAAQAQVDQLEQQISSLDRVETDLRDALSSGTSRLQQLVTDQCGQTPATETGATGATGTTDTGGATGPEEEQPDELTKEEKEALKEQRKALKEQEKEQRKQEQQGNEENQDESTGGSGGGDDTGSGGVAP